MIDWLSSICVRSYSDKWRRIIELAVMLTLAISIIGIFKYWATLYHFMEQGGPVLLVIMAATFLLWLLILERLHYFLVAHKKLTARAIDLWQKRGDKHSWYARQIRQRLLSVVRLNAERNFSHITFFILIAPLLGLLGTVTGMIDVFDVMAVTGSGNARAMAAGVSKATIPTMAGMVVSLSGLLFSLPLQRRARINMEVLGANIAIESRHA